MKTDEKINVYILEIDNYGQPNGIVQETTMTRERYLTLKEKGHWIYDNMHQAFTRAQS